MVGSEVTSFHSHTSAAMVTRRCRLQAVIPTYESGASGTITVHDNTSSASGKLLLEIDVTTQGSDEVYIPGDGILAKKGLYVTIPNNTKVTVFVE